MQEYNSFQFGLLPREGPFWSWEENGPMIRFETTLVWKIARE